MNHTSKSVLMRRLYRVFPIFMQIARLGAQTRLAQSLDRAQSLAVSSETKFLRSFSGTLDTNQERLGMKLTADFYPVAVWIDYHALIVTIAGTSRPIDNRESIVPQTLCELIDQALRAYRDREMGQPKALSSGRQSYQRQRRRRHRFEACPVGETKKAGLESLRGIQVTRTRRGAKVRRVEMLAPSEIGGPNRDVFYPHRLHQRGIVRSRAAISPPATT
jgi:hypothetical protein